MVQHRLSRFIDLSLKLVQPHICGSNLTPYLMKLSYILFFESIHAYVKISNIVQSWPKKDLRHPDRAAKYGTGSIRDLHLSEAKIGGQLK